MVPVSTRGAPHAVAYDPYRDLRLENLDRSISGVRHVELHGGLKWEIDVFHGENDGLVVAEVELPSEHTAIEMPSWAGEEVSSDPRYFNSNLLSQPYSTWRRS